MKTVTLGEVVEIPPLRLVMRLADVDTPDSEAAREILETFVVTPEIAGHLRALLDALAAPNGVGCFVKGHYGSGKSHFLGFLALLVHSDERIRRAAAARLPEGLRGPRAVFQIRVTLQRHSADAALEDIVVEAAEQALAGFLGRREVLSDVHFLVENFNALLLDRHPEFLVGVGLTAPQWRELCVKQGLQAARHVADFLATLPSNPLRARSDRDRWLDRLYALLPPDTPIVILIDELSEFLKARPSARAFNNDLRWLQFVGEATQSRPLWVVATMQEAIEDIGYEDTELVLRIKDRYRLRFSLSATHVEALIEGRLVHKKPAAAEVIAGVWKRLSGAFPEMRLTVEHFQRIYPVHPATLSMLENLMGLFSQHRGVVDFVHARLAGDPSRNIEGMLGEPADRLLSCEAIFDHFQERIRETPDSAAYVNVAWRFLESDIERLFSEARDRNMALRAVKIMILAELSPLERPRTVRQLAHLVAQRLTTVDPTANYLYLKERVLDRLAAESSYVRRTAADDPLDTVYGIDLEANAAQMVEARTRSLMRGLDVGPQLWFRVLKGVDAPVLPMSNLCGVGPTDHFLYWQRTSRQGQVLVGDLSDITVAQFTSDVGALATSERDWMLLVATPHDVGHQEQVAHRLFEHAATHRFAPLVGAWIPRMPSTADLDTCTRVLAQRQLLEQVRGEGPAGEPLAAVLDDLLPSAMSRLREIIVDSYFSGTILFADGGAVSPESVGRHNFSRFLHDLFDARLSLVFDQHTQIRPLTDDHAQERLDKLWTHLVLSGRLERAEASTLGLNAVLDGVAMQLGIVRKEGKGWSLTADPARHALLAELLRSIVPGQTVGLQALYLKLRKGRWGILRPYFSLAVGVLVQLGHVAAWREGRPVVVENLKKLNHFGVDALGEGRILEPAEREQLPALGFVAGKALEPAAFSLSTQQALWTDVSQGARKIQTQAAELRSVLRRHEGYPSLQRLPLTEVENDLARMEQVASSLDPRLDSRDGLSAVLARVSDDDAEAHGRFIHWHAFFREHLAEYQRFHRAMASPPADVDEALVEMARDVGGRIERGQWAETWDAFVRFVEQYAARYEQAHDAFYADAKFVEWAQTEAAPEVRLLERLGRLYGVEVEHDAVWARRQLLAAPRPCRRRVREAVTLNWACECGFAMGTSPDVPSPAPLLEHVREGLEAYAAALHAPAVREKLETHARALGDVGRREQAERLARLAAACRPPKPRLLEAPQEALVWLTDATLDEVNQALRGRVLVVERRLEELEELLTDRVLAPQAVRQALERWLGTLDRETFVRVVGRAPVSAVHDTLHERVALEEEARVLQGAEAAAFVADETVHLDLSRGVSDRLLKETLEDGHRDQLERVRDALRGGRAADVPHVRAAVALLDLALLLCSQAGDVVEDYITRLSALPLALDHRGIDAEVPAYLLERLEADAAAQLAAHAARFSTVSGVLAMDEVATAVLDPLVARYGGCVLVIMDAMRWDLWRRFQPAIDAALSTHVFEGVRPILAMTPTRTAENRAALIGGLDFVLVAAADRLAKRAAVSEAVSRREGLSVVHFLFVDERLHGTSLPLSTLYPELDMELESLVLPHLRAVDSAVPVVMIADHGFVYDGGRNPPYSHGGASAFERIVPCAVWVPRG